MAINKKSLVSKSSTTNSKSSATASKPVTSGKMVPSMRLGKAGGLQVSKAGIATSKSAGLVNN